MDNRDRNQYWASVPSDEIGSVLQGKVDEYYAYLTSSSLVDLWRKSYYAYYGMATETSLTGFGMFDIGSIYARGAEGEIAGVKVNHYRNLLTHLLVLTTQNRPEGECRAVNSDSKSLAQAKLGDGILDYYTREKQVEGHFTDATEIALVFGEGFIRRDWDATAGRKFGVGENGQPIYDGDVKLKTYNPFDVIRDTTRTSSKDHPWYIFHDIEVQHDLAAKYPALRDEILTASTDITSGRRFVDPTKVIAATGVGTKKSDLIDVYELVHMPTPAVPQGRYTVMIQGGIVLFDGPLPFKKNPAHRISASEVIGAAFGWTIGFDILGIQEAIDKLYTILLTNNLATGMQNFWQPPGNGLTKTQIAGGLNLLESIVEPKALQLCASPAETYKLLQMLENVMEILSGVSAVNRGATPENLKSGSALAFVASQAITFSSNLQKSYNNLVESVDDGIIDLLKTYATTPRIAMIVGSFNRPLLKEFTGTDLEGIDRVVVETVSSVSKTTAGKIQIAQDLLQSSLIRTAREYLTVVNTGQLDSMTEGDMAEIINVHAENEDLREGKQVMALIIDDHEFHVLEHRAILNSPDSRRDPQLVENVLAHINAHIQMNLQLQQENPALLAIIKERPLPSPQPPPPPPPPPAAAGPQQPGGPVQNQIAPPGQPQPRAPSMPNLPRGADQAAHEAYAQMQTAS